nr:DUF3883 domain-containing protein [Paenibacillus ihbetae]
MPMDGTLVDTRDLGCGYDFEIINGNLKSYIEVKGLGGHTGGVMFTNKEWQLAKEKMENYYLIIVQNVKDEAKYYSKSS